MFDTIPTTIRHILVFIRYCSLIVDSTAEIKMPRDMWVVTLLWNINILKYNNNNNNKFLLILS